jgi:sigma-B regulation protein RsbU (phosphoserine phosphatase)
VPGAAYQYRRSVLEPGDVLVLHSDGLTGAQDRRGTFFGPERLDSVLAKEGAHGADAVCAGLVRGLDHFLDGRALQDDVTIVVLERQG